MHRLHTIHTKHPTGFFHNTTTGKPQKHPQNIQRERNPGGVDRDRTDDLIIANDTLYQLSYNPICFLWKFERIMKARK